MHRAFRSLALAASLAAVAAPALAAEKADDIQRVRYACDGGQVLEIVFLNTAGGNSHAIVLLDGKMIPMGIAMSGSGARYLSLDPQPGRQLWTARDGADLVALDGRAQTSLRTNCSLDDRPPR